MTRAISVEGAIRQSFGVMFTHTSRDADLAKRIIDGEVHLSPHPAWSFGEKFSWTADPFSERNWRAQLHMLRWLDPLRRRAEKGDDRAGETWIRHARDWVESNPPTAASPREAWMNMVDGIRALELCLSVPFVAQRFPDDLGWLADSIALHGMMLSDERRLGHSNHALHQHQGLFVCGTVLEDTTMQDLAVARLESLFTSAYDDEGVNAEGAIAYHMANYSWWAVAQRRLTVEGRPIPPRMSVLDHVPLELAHATKPSGQLVSIGDTDGGSAARIDHPATRWVSTNGADGEPPEDVVRIYDAGYLFARSGWGEQERDFRDETFWSVSFGSPKRVHGHVDGGSLTFSSMGHEWIADPGKYQYADNAMRDYCLRRASHSLVSITGKSYEPHGNVECTARRLDASIYDVTFTDLGFPGVRLTRRIVYSVAGEYAVVLDTIDSEDEVEAVQTWQCGPGTQAEETRRGFELTGPDGRRAILHYSGTTPSLSSVTGSEDPCDGWVATGWRMREAAPSLRFTKTGRRFRFVTVVAAGFRGAAPTLETVRSGVAGQLRLRIDTGRVAEQIAIDRSTAAVIGYGDESPETSAPSNRPAGPRLNPCDATLRRRIFRETRRARRAAWESRGALDVDEASRDIRALLADYEVDSGIDLGLQSALSDLTSVSNAALDRRTIRRDRPGLMNWSGAGDFQPTALKAPVLSVDGTEEPLPALEVDTLVTFSLGPLVLPALVCPGPGTTLTAMFQTAVDRARVNLPLFQRIRFQKELGAGPTVVFADPTLDLSRELRLGWYLGTEEVHLTEMIRQAIARIASTLGTRRTVLQGSSGGGFAALQVGAGIRGSHVVAANPQTDLRRYNATSYRAAMIASFGSPTVPRGTPFTRRVSVMEELEAQQSDMQITLVMNTGDLFHEKNHAAPLRKQVSSSPGVRLTDVAKDLGPGHRGLDNDQYREIMMRVYQEVDATSDH